MVLERLIFRKSRGHSFLIFKPRPNHPETSVFLCFMNKNMHKHIGEKVYKACTCNDVSIYELPDMMKNLQEYEKILMKKHG